MEDIKNEDGISITLLKAALVLHARDKFKLCRKVLLNAVPKDAREGLFEDHNLGFPAEMRDLRYGYGLASCSLTALNACIANVEKKPNADTFQTYYEETNFSSRNLEAIRKVIGGHTPNIIQMFAWHGSPQGGEYWAARHEGDAALNEEDVRFLEGLLEYVEGKPDDEELGPEEDYSEVEGVNIEALTNEEVSDEKEQDYTAFYEAAEFDKYGIRYVRQAIDGNAANIDGAFYWSDSPQGHRYWEERCYGGTPLNADDIRFFQGILDYYDGLTDLKEPEEDYSEVEVRSVEHLKSAMSGQPGSLVSAFQWSTTRQGAAYWAARYRCEVPLTEDDIEYLEGLLKYTEGNS